MILTCPACNTRYVVQDGAVPPGGRQVRCASCRHSWFQLPDSSAEPGVGSVDPSPQPQATETPSTAQSPTSVEIAPEPTDENPAGEVEDAHFTADQRTNQAPGESADSWAAPVLHTTDASSAGKADDAAAEHTMAAPAAAPDPGASAAGEDSEDDFVFTGEEAERRRRLPILPLILAILIAVALALYFLAPMQWRERFGMAGVQETPLLLQVRNSDRQQLASGNELFEVSGRVINPTDQPQDVPPLKAELRDSGGKLIYSWTISPPARVLPPGASASFNSAEMNVPEGAERLTVTLGPPAA